MVKGQSIVIEKLYNYDRSFVNKEPRVYKFGNKGKDFQEYLGKDKDGNNQYNRIPILFPDHAILEADFDII